MTVENPTEITNFEGYSFRITLSPEEYAYQTHVAFFYGKNGENLIIFRDSGNMLRVKDEFKIEHSTG